MSIQLPALEHLYWNFLLEHRETLERNPRLAMAYRTLAAMSDERKSQ